jgi:hypothetical protein
MLMLFRRRKAVRTARACRYRSAPGVVSAQHGARTILLDAHRGEYFGVDEVGAEIWRMLGTGATVVELVDGLERAYEAPRERLARDAADFVALLEHKRLVVSA